MSALGELFGGGKKKKRAVVEPEPEDEEDPRKKAAAQAGRASLIRTSPQGVLGNASVGRRQLTAI